MGLDDIDDSDEDVLASGLSKDLVLEELDESPKKALIQEKNPPGQEQPAKNSLIQEVDAETKQPLQEQTSKQKISQVELDEVRRVKPAVRSHGGLLDVPSSDKENAFSDGLSVSDANLSKFLISEPKSTVNRSNSTKGDESKFTKVDSKETSSAPSTTEAKPEVESTTTQSTQSTSTTTDTLTQPTYSRENVEENDAQSELLLLAQKRRKQKEAETTKAVKEAARKKEAELVKDGGLFKKGFLNSGKSKNRPSVGTKSSGQLAKEFLDKAEARKAAKKADIDLTKLNKEKAVPDLTLPEVQQAMNATLKDTDSWVTPELAKVLASRPDLIQGMNNPRVQECLAMMKTHPQEAKAKFGDDEEVQNFLKNFSSLMGTHFDLLAKQEEKKVVAQPKATPAPVITPSQATTKTAETTTAAMKKKKKGSNVISKTAFAAAASNMNLSKEESEKFQDPKVIDAMMCPKVQWVIGQVRQGKPMDMRQIGREDPKTMERLQYLISRGILGMRA